MSPDIGVLTLTVNGRRVEADVEHRTSLADLLRDRLGLTGTHLGCEQGVCGACTVQVDGLVVRSCLTLAMACQDSEVVTIEGLRDDDATRLRAAFAREGALQCGFCTPGMVLTAHALVRVREPLSRAAVCEAMAGNICRCTGYNGIVRAVRSANAEAIDAESDPEAGPPLWPVVGNSGDR